MRGVMIPPLHGWGYLPSLASGSRFTTAAQAIFNAATTQPTQARKIIINNLVVALQVAGIWNSLDLLYVLAAADSQIARLNWVSPATFTAAEVSAPTFAIDRGYTGDGAASRLNTNWTPSTNGVNFVQDNASMWVWSRTTGTEAVSCAGNNSSTIHCMINPRSAGNTVNLIRINDGTNGTAGANTDGTGFYGVQRTSAAAKRAFRNGVQSGADIAQASTGVANLAQWICAANSSQFSTRQMAAAAWGSGLAGKELAFFNAMNAYMTAVGAA